MKFNILVLGTGAIGSLFAAYLSSEAKIFCVGRREHIKSISKRGKIKVNRVFSGESFEASVELATDNLNELLSTEFDYVLVTTKAFDLYGAVRGLVEKDIAFKTIVLFQNGIGIVDEAKKALEGRKHCILRALTYNGANIPEPGVVNHAGIGETLIGSIEGACKEELESLISLMNACGLPARHVDNIKKFEFEKLVVNATINPITAILRVRNGFVAENKYAREITERIIEEFKIVADKEGVSLENPIKKVIEVAKKTKDNLSSMLQDILNKRKTEIDFINGKIVELGKKHGVETPINEMIHKLVKAIENTYLR